MKIMVLGAGGMLGREVCVQLGQQSEHTVVSVGRSSSGSDPFNFMVDLQDEKAVGQLLKAVNPDAIINCAGGFTGNDANPYQSFVSPLLRQVIRICPEARVVLIGSAQVYGSVPASDLPVAEDYPGKPPFTPRAKAKRREIALARRYYKKGLPVTVAQMSTIVGANTPPNQLLPKLITVAQQIRAGKTVEPISGPLESRRGYIHVSDAARALILLATTERQPDCAYNVGASDSLSNADLATLVANKFGRSSDQLMTGSGHPDLYAYHLDTTKIKAQYSWQPEYNSAQAVDDVS